MKRTLIWTAVFAAIVGSSAWAQTPGGIARLAPDGLLRLSDFRPGTTCVVEWASAMEAPDRMNWQPWAAVAITGQTTYVEWPMWPRGAALDSSFAPTQGLVAYYPLEGSGLDASGHGHNGTLVSGPITTNGRIGQALYLNNSIGHVAVPGSSAFAFTNLSIAAWIRCNNYSNPTPSYIVTDSTSTGIQGGFEFDVTRGKLHFHYRISTNPIFYDSYSTNMFWPSDNGKWHHVAVTCQYGGGAYSIRMYRDGALFYTDSVTSVPMAYSNNELTLGTNYDHRLFDGTLDEVHLYNRALTALEVQSLFQLAP